MIELEIIKSDDHEVIGIKKFNKNSIYLGKNAGDILIESPDIINYHLFIEILEEQNILYCHPHQKCEYYLVNDKRCESPRKLNINDTITIGNTTLKISNFLFQKFDILKNEVENELEKLIHNKSDLIEIIQEMEEYFNETE